MVAVTIYDGAETIGGNKIFVDGGRYGYFLDFGRNFKKYGQYFEEFLKARDTRGLHDPLTLELLPRIRVYRDDLLPGDAPPLKRLSVPLVAVIVSHAHLDHCGHIGILDSRIPIVTTPTTAAILKGMQDCGRASLDTCLAYGAPRSRGEDPRYLPSSKATIPFQGREFLLTAPPTEELKGFLAYRPGASGPRTRGLCAGACCQYGEHAFPFRVFPFEVDHSIYGACAFVIEDDTTIAYTGDIRFHGRFERETGRFLDRARDASVLIMEGTRAGDPTPGRVSEQDVAEQCRAVVEEAPGLVIADFGPRNFERLESFLEIAVSTGRALVVPAKDCYMLRSIETVDGVCRTGSNLLVYREVGSDDRNERRWETEMTECDEAPCYVDPVEIRNDPARFILCFSFYDMKHLLDIKPDSGTYIYSACEAFNEEMVIDFQRLWTWLCRFDFSVHGFHLDRETYGDDRPRFDPRFHASGHAHPSDLTTIVDRVDPDHLIPVHTERQDWFAEQFENVVLMRDGETRAF